MSRKLTLMVLAGVLALSTTGVLAGTREQRNDRKRDGSGENCTLSGTQECRGGGNGDRKCDGSCVVTP